MTCPLPPEILDLIVDNLHDKRTALLACCVVSKSWIPRTRRHIFAHVKFNRSRFPVESWTKVFPDPSNSPAHYTQSLTFLNVQLVTPIGQDVVRWVSAFHNVVRLRVGTRDLDRDCQISFVPLRGLSPAVRSLHLDSTYPQHSEVFGLLCSFPLLEDFTLEAFRCWNGADEWETPLTSPTLSGSLELCSVIGGIGLITRRLLDLPSGPNFTNIVLACVYEADFKATTDLVSGCSGTIESLDVADYLPDDSEAVLIDLSTATKLKDLVFRSKNLRQITIRPDPNTSRTIEDTVRREWEDLDRLLVQFPASRSIRPKLTYGAGVGGRFLRDQVPSLLPELTGRGLIDLICNC